MEYTLSVTELVRNFADYVNRVFYRRERFVLTREEEYEVVHQAITVSESLS